MVAERFGKKHDNVLRDIENVLAGLLKIEETPIMFQRIMYRHEQNNQLYPEYLMNRDGFSLLAMGFTGSDALMNSLNAILR